MPRGLGVKTMDAPASVTGLRDPHIQPGQDFNAVDLGNGNVIALCPACFAAAVESVLGQLSSALASGEGGVNPATKNAVNWNSVNWNSFDWNAVNWNSVAWHPVNWNS